MGDHVCHAAACSIPVPPAIFMCRGHWRAVPPDLKRAVLRTYRPGQEADKRPSQAYITAHKRAVNAVARAEGRPAPYPAVEVPAAPVRYRPGELAISIREALAAGRTLTPGECDAVRDLHPYGEPGKACPGCRFVFRRGARSCPSRLFVTAGPRAGLDAVPAATAVRRCRDCHGPVSVPADTPRTALADGPVCDSCSFQPSLDLFGGS